PRAQRETILQRFYLELSAIEAGRLQGRNANAIYQLQHRAIANLRTALLAGLAVVLIALAVWLARGVGPSQQVSTDPVEDGPTSIEEPGPEPPPSDGEVGDEEGGDARTELRSPDASGRTPSSTPTEEPAPADQPSGAGLAADEPSAVEELTSPTNGFTNDGASTSDLGPTPTRGVDPSQPAEPSPPPTTVVAEPDPTTTTTVGAPTTTAPAPSATTLPPSAPATQGLNRCIVFPVGSRVVFTLYDPAGEIGDPGAYRSPALLRLVNDAGDTLLEVETDGFGVDGDTSGSVGWLEFENGVRTHRSYASASPPTEWGLIIDSSVPDDWRAVEYTDAEGAWVRAPACNI
ncbi:MAG: hypothetical protein AAF547_18660, partial [Actinomycetota bacterium]